MLLALLLRSQVRSRFRLVYGQRHKTAQELYPAVQEEASQGFFRSIFITPVLKNSQPVNCAFTGVQVFGSVF